MVPPSDRLKNHQRGLVGTTVPSWGLATMAVGCPGNGTAECLGRSVPSSSGQRAEAGDFG